MKTLFGMRIFPERKHLTDDEIVSQVRRFLEKYEGRRKWLLGLPIFFSLITMLLIGWLVQMVAKLAPVLQGVQAPPELWFIVGLVTGWYAGHLLTATVKSFISAVGKTLEMRTKRLLVQYYDAYAAVCAQDLAEETTGENAQ